LARKMLRDLLVVLRVMENLDPWESCGKEVIADGLSAINLCGALTPQRLASFWTRARASGNFASNMAAECASRPHVLYFRFVQVTKFSLRQPLPGAGAAAHALQRPAMPCRRSRWRAGWSGKNPFAFSTAPRARQSVQRSHPQTSSVP